MLYRSIIEVTHSLSNRYNGKEIPSSVTVSDGDTFPPRGRLFNTYKKGALADSLRVRSMTNYLAELFFFITITKRAAASSTRLPPMMVNIMVPLPPVEGSFA